MHWRNSRNRQVAQRNKCAFPAAEFRTRHDSRPAPAVGSPASSLTRSRRSPVARRCFRSHARSRVERHEIKPDGERQRVEHHGSSHAARGLTEEARGAVAGRHQREMAENGDDVDAVVDDVGGGSNER
eukprot:5574414-Prymnesium_polylepis.3